MMDSSDEGSDNELFLPRSSARSVSEEFPIPERSQLKPKLDTIFAEVEKNLPSIDFDLSDVSSDNDEPLIFHRPLKGTTFDDDKDLDTSLSGESFSEFMSSNIDAAWTEEKLAAGSTAVYDNDAAVKKQSKGKGLVTKGPATTWTEVVIETREDKNKFPERLPPTKVQNWMETEEDATSESMPSVIMPDAIASAFSAMEKELSTGNEISIQTSDSEDLEKYENEETTEGSKKSKSYSGPGDLNSEDKRMNKQLMMEEQRRNEQDIVTNIVSPTAPKLLSTVSSLNIDLVLHSLTEDSNFSVPPVVREAWALQQRRIESIYAAGEGSNRIVQENNQNNSQGTLIQRLAQMSMQQLGEDLSDIDPNTGALRRCAPDDDRDIDERSNSPLLITNPPVPTTEKVPTPPEQQTPPPSQDNTGALTAGEPQKKSTSSCGTNTSDLQPMKVLTPRPWKSVTEPEDPKVKEKPDDRSGTVFIDLRNFDEKCKEKQQNIERVKQILQIDQESSSDDSDSEHDSELWFEQRRRMKQQLAAKRKAEPDNVKPRLSRGEGFKKPPRVIHLSEKDNKQKEKEDAASEDLDEVERQEMEARRRQREEEREKVRRLEEARKLREEREAERQSRLRLAKRLEALRPSASVGGRQDGAEATAVLFDMEASYEPAPHTLPVTLRSDLEVLLLTIHLSSNGEIVLHRGKTNKSVDTGVGLSASYTVLVTWLLSLVPDNFDFFLPGQTATSKSDQPVFYNAPFYVVGLQQMWMDEHLNLVVAVTPTMEFDAKYVPSRSKKSKMKDEVKDSSPFQQLVSKYLSTNTLHSVCGWLQDLVSVEVPGPKPGTSSPGYIYRPPLPNITTKPLSTFVQINPDPTAASKVFNTAVGFFWQTVDSDEALYEQTLNDSNVLYDTQVTMSLVYKKIFHDARSMMGIFNRVLQEGLDLAGIRLVYPSKQQIGIASTGSPKVPNESQNAQSENDILNKIGPVLCIALRGTFARSIWLDAIGPSDPVLARRTDPNSLCALYGGDSRDECLLFCPRNPSRIQTELSRWFGGRVPPGGVIDVGTPYTRKDHTRSSSPKGRKSKRVSFSDEMETDHEVILHRRPPASLSATTKSDIFLVLSPLVPPQCLGIVMATCQRRGYQIRGVRRHRLTSKKAGCLGISIGHQSAFCPPSIDSAHLDPTHGTTPPTTILLLEKENAAHSAASLIEACMIQLTLSGTMVRIQQSTDMDIQSGHLLHAARYSDGLQTNLGGDFTKCIDQEIQVNPSYIVPKLYTNPEVEQVVVLLILGHDILKSSGLFVGKLLNAVPYSKTTPVLPLKEGFELLGIKWVATLSKSQAKEVNPYEIGDRMWKDSIHTLTSEPALVLVMRSVDAFSKLQSIIPSVEAGRKAGHIDYIMSSNAEEAYSFTRAFFSDRELFTDPQARTLAPYMPPDGVIDHNRQSHREDTHKDSVFGFMLRGPRPLTTLLVIKPRCLKKHLSKILHKITLEGFTLVGMRLKVLNQEEARRLVPDEVEQDEAVVSQHVDYLVSGPSLILVLSRENAVRKLLDLLGPLDPMSARRQNQFLWRGTFGVDSIVNGLHGSIDYQTSVEEQIFFFGDGLCCNPTDDLIHEKIMCPASDSEMDMCFYDNRDIVLHQLTDNQQEVLEHHLLLQTTCVVLKPPLVTIKNKGQYPYIELMEGMLKQGFEIVGSRMVWFNQEQSQVFLHLINAGSYKEVPLLTSGPCVVLALQRDNAVLAFDSIMGCDYGADSLIGRYGGLIGRPADIHEAHKMLMFFFRSLIPGSQVEITAKTN